MAKMLTDQSSPDQLVEREHDRDVHLRGRCDRCGSRAYVEIIMSAGLLLHFCAHHFGQHEKVLASTATKIIDGREALG